MTDSIKAYLHKIRNACRDIFTKTYHFFRKHSKRNAITVALIILALVIGLSIGKAWAGEGQPKTKMLNQKADTYIHARPATTTTTTTAPPKKSYKVATTHVRVIPAPQGDWIPQCKIWMSEAGIPEDVWDSALYLIGRESKCNPYADNRNSSAYGIPQAMGEGKKMSSAGADYRDNPVTQLRWMHSYCTSRYGGWSQAAQHSKNRGWY